jgi:hypothetical protein
LALDPSVGNKRLAPLGGETATNNSGNKVFICSNLDTTKLNDPNVTSCMPTIASEERIGRTFLKETEADGQGFRARVVCAIVDKDAKLKQEPEYI